MIQPQSWFLAKVILFLLYTHNFSYNIARYGRRRKIQWYCRSIWTLRSYFKKAASHLCCHNWLLPIAFYVLRTRLYFQIKHSIVSKTTYVSSVVHVRTVGQTKNLILADYLTVCSSTIFCTVDIYIACWLISISHEIPEPSPMWLSPDHEYGIYTTYKRLFTFCI